MHEEFSRNFREGELNGFQDEFQEEFQEGLLNEISDADDTLPEFHSDLQTEEDAEAADWKIPESLWKNLNDAQREAVAYGDGPLLVVAGAGTGKTTMLAHRVANLAARGADPSRILLLTFSRRAAAELVQRATHLLETVSREQSARIARIWGGTFHAVGTRLLRIYGKHVGLPPNFAILDRADQEDLMNLVRAEVVTVSDSKRFPKKGTCVSMYSRCINSQKKLYEILAHYYPKFEEYLPELSRLFDAYMQRKVEDALLDYDDLLLYWSALMRHPEIGEKIRNRFGWVLVDEFQDTNRIQAEIVKGLTPDGRGLTVVGDDDQSIYSFRSATVRNILELPNVFPDTKIIPLEMNYRSRDAILKATNRVIAQLPERYRKELFSSRKGGVLPTFCKCRDEDAQTNYIADRILEHFENGTPLREQAVLFRSSSHSVRLETELARRRIPYVKYGGLKFTESAHVKDLLSFLRLAENPNDLPAGMRLLNMLPGIGPKTARTLMGLLRDAGGNLNVWSSWTPPKRTGNENWFAVVSLLKELAVSQMPLREQIQAALDLYRPILQEQWPLDGDSRLADLEQLLDVAKKFKGRRELLSELVLDPPQSSEEFADKPDIDDDYLILSTIHSAKGLEWKSVYVIHASDGNIPSDMSTGRQEDIDEELRLFYVAMTRAKDYLYVTCPLQYFHAGKPSWSSRYSRVLPTRFLPKKILKDCFEEDVCYDVPDPDDVEDFRNILAEEGLTPEEWIRSQTDLW